MLTDPIETQNSDALFALDVGNTQTVWAKIDQTGSILKKGRFKTAEIQEKLFELLASDSLFEASESVHVAISSVNPDINAFLRECFSTRTPFFIDHKATRFFDLAIENEAQMGPDRLANIAGAIYLTEHRPNPKRAGKRPFIIVDAGTATTFCVVDENRVFWGGSIAPGIEISAEALAQKAKKLFSIDLSGARPESIIGSTTEEQLKSGALFTYEAMIEGFTDRLIHDAEVRGMAGFRSTEPGHGVQLFLTGGCGHYFELTSRFQFEPDLTLIGIFQYWKWNHGNT